MARLSAVIALLFVVLLAPVAEAAIPTEQREALEAIYNSTGGANWTNRSGWMGSPGTECGWFGVVCDPGQLSVVGLNLPQNNLSGPIPSEIGALEDLEFIAFWDNALSGPIPPSIGSLSFLGALYLEENQLTGSIPPEIGDLADLEDLRLWDNQLTGPIPPELGDLGSLTILSISENQFSGSIPDELSKLGDLEVLHLNSNQLTGSIPSSFANLAFLVELSVHTNQLTGSIPSFIGDLEDLEDFRASYNQFTGPIPDSIGSLSKLRILYLGENPLSGTIPASLANLPAMEDFEIWNTDVSGTIPVGFGGMPNLHTVYLYGNELSGSIPSDIGNSSSLVFFDASGNALSEGIPTNLGNISTLQYLNLRDNELTGSIPSSLGSLSQLNLLRLERNRLSGTIPTQLGNLSNLRFLRLHRNALTGEIPSSLMNLTTLNNAESDIGYNGLYTSNSALRSFLNSKQRDGDFEATQTVMPTNVAFAASGAGSASLTWTPIPYTEGAGGYRIKTSMSPSGPFTIATTTSSRAASSARIGGLAPQTTYFFKLDTIAFRSDQQKNEIVSAETAAVSGTTLALAPRVEIGSSPSVLTAIADGVSVDSTIFTIVNLGQLPTTVNLSADGSFFTLSSSSIQLSGSGTERVTITSLPQSTARDYRGSVTLSGADVAPNTRARVTLFATPAPPAGEPRVVVETTRVDVSGPVGSNPSGSVTFRNVGTGVATGLLGADVPWIVPDSDVASIEPGSTRTFNFTIDRSQRPDASALSGTQTGNLSFIYVAGSDALVFGRDPFAGAPTLAAPVGVGDTVKPDVETVAGIPLLQDNEVGLIIPGVGNVTGSVGVFISDITIANGLSGLALDDLKLHYTSGGETRSATQPMQSGQSLALADVIATVFEKTEQIGVLHVRSAKTLELAMNANVFNKSNSSGTYGTAIPVFRSDRAAAAGEALLVTGLRKTATSHTNLYLQEAIGTASTAQVEFLNDAGAVIGTLANQAVPAFGTTILGQQFVPEGAVTARITNMSGGGIVSYATPVDRASGDTWAITDWTKVYAIEEDDRQIVPVAGSAPGRNNTYFKTDLAVVSASANASAKIRYHQQTPAVQTIEKTVSLGAGETLTFDDVVATFFGATPPSLGFIELVPDAGSDLSMTSRTYTTVEGSAQTFGTGVPTLPPSFALRRGQSVVIGGLEDSTAATTNAGTPATFRTNVGLVEIEGVATKVRVSVLLYDGAQLAAGGKTASRDIDLAPRELRQLNAIVGSVIGTQTREEDFGELRNVQVRVDVIDGDGAVIVYATQTDNGTGDTVLRVQ